MIENSYVSVQETANQLLALARTDMPTQARAMCAFSVLRHTSQAEAAAIVAGIGDYLAYADTYAEASPGLALEWFAEVISPVGADEQAAAYARILHERAGVWYGEALALALSAALHDRTALR